MNLISAAMRRPITVLVGIIAVALGAMLALQRMPVDILPDLGLFKVRPLFSTLPGVSAPPPFGGQQRTMVIRVDPERLRAYNMSPDEVVRAIGSANTISPSGVIRIGDRMPMVPVNSVVPNI